MIFFLFPLLNLCNLSNKDSKAGMSVRGIADSKRELGSWKTSL